MFKKRKQEMQHSDLNNTSNIIGKGTALEGNLTTAGNIRIEGKLVGSINTEAKVVLGNTAWVKGHIVAQNAEIGGEVYGTIEVSGLLILRPTAIVHGDLIIHKLIFEEGAQFNGKCKMEDAVVGEQKKEAGFLKKDSKEWLGKQNTPKTEENVLQKQQVTS